MSLTYTRVTINYFDKIINFYIRYRLLPSFNFYFKKPNLERMLGYYK